MRATLQDMAQLKRHGLRVEPYGKHWVLVDSDGSHLMIGDHGCLSPTKWEAVAEGLHRIEAGHYGEMS